MPLAQIQVRGRSLAWPTEPHVRPLLNLPTTLSLLIECAAVFRMKIVFIYYSAINVLLLAAV